jgi:hypothetical protein
LSVSASRLFAAGWVVAVVDTPAGGTNVDDVGRVSVVVVRPGPVDVVVSGTVVAVVVVSDTVVDVDGASVVDVARSVVDVVEEDGGGAVVDEVGSTWAAALPPPRSTTAIAARLAAAATARFVPCRFRTSPLVPICPSCPFWTRQRVLKKSLKVSAWAAETGQWRRSTSRDLALPSGDLPVSRPSSASTTTSSPGS